MRVKVVSDWVAILAGLGAEGRVKLTLFLGAGNEYTVYGLSLHRESSIYRGGTLVCKVVDDYGNLTSAPIDIFDVVDGAMPKEWRIEKRFDGVFMWPDLFHREFFFDDLSEGVPECVAEFRSLKSKMEGVVG